jgi:hypothetical protein
VESFSEVQHPQVEHSDCPAIKLDTNAKAGLVNSEAYQTLTKHKRQELEMFKAVLKQLESL